MIKDFDKNRIDEIMDIWLNANIDAHDFIDAKYWIDNFEMVKSILPGADILIYEENEKVKGFIGISDGQNIEGIFVSKDFQRTGIGKELLDECKKRYGQLSLCVYVKNENAVNFYKKNGFLIKEESLDKNTSEKEYVMIWSK